MMTGCRNEFIPGVKTDLVSINGSREGHRAIRPKTSAGTDGPAISPQGFSDRPESLAITSAARPQASNPQ